MRLLVIDGNSGVTPPLSNGSINSGVSLSLSIGSINSGVTPLPLSFGFRDTTVPPLGCISCLALWRYDDDDSLSLFSLFGTRVGTELVKFNRGYDKKFYQIPKLKQ